MNDLQLIETEANQCLTNAEKIIVNNQITYEKASDYLRGVKGLQKKVEETFAPIIDKAHQAHKEAIAGRDKHLIPLKTAEGIIKNRISGYLAECERIRRTEELRLQQEAEERARKERERLAARAEKWEEKGNDAKAEALKEQAEQVEAIVPTVAPIVQKANGQSVRTTWKAKVTDFKALLDDYKLPNQPLLDSIARSTKGQIKIAGVEFYEEKTLIQR